MATGYGCARYDDGGRRPHKREIVERLWKLEQSLGGLPEIPAPIVRLHLQRAHVWFNQRPVSSGKSW
jgi:hypothetical protein